MEKTEWGETESSSNGSKKFEYKDSYRARGTGPVTPVLAGTYFSRKIPFLQKAGNEQSVCMNFGLARLIILNGKSVSRSARFWLPMHSIYCYAHKVLYCAKS